MIVDGRARTCSAFQLILSGGQSSLYELSILINKGNKNKIEKYNEFKERHYAQDDDSSSLYNLVDVRIIPYIKPYIWK